MTLRLLGGLTTDEIARAFLVPEATIAQRIVRAKRTLSEASVSFEVPRAPELASRVASVLEVVYLVFNGRDSPAAILLAESARGGGLPSLHRPGWTTQTFHRAGPYLVPQSCTPVEHYRDRRGLCFVGRADHQEALAVGGGRIMVCHRLNLDPLDAGGNSVLGE